MKRIYIHVLLAVGLMANIASTQGMGRFTQSVRAAVKQHTVYPNHDCPRTLVPFTGKWFTQKKFDLMKTQSRDGILPSTSDMNAFMGDSKINNYAILNQQDNEGHTLFNDVLKNGDYSSQHRYLIKALLKYGARLSNRDKHVMGPESLLKTYLGLPLTASASTTIKVLRTFNTKNSPEKLGFKVLTDQMTDEQFDARTQKRSDVNNVYNTIKPELDARCMQERLDAKKRKWLME